MYSSESESWSNKANPDCVDEGVVLAIVEGVAKPPKGAAIVMGVVQKYVEMVLQLVFFD